MSYVLATALNERNPTDSKFVVIATNMCLKWLIQSRHTNTLDSALFQNAMALNMHIEKTVRVVESNACIVCGMSNQAPTVSVFRTWCGFTTVMVGCEVSLYNMKHNRKKRRGYDCRSHQDSERVLACVRYSTCR